MARRKRAIKMSSAVKPLKLVEIDLSRCCKKSYGRGESWHPDIDPDRYYLAEIESANRWSSGYFAGQFSEQWYGYSFDGWGGGGGLTGQAWNES